jgi:formamidopyrimidine-DNA glycosylase
MPEGPEVRITTDFLTQFVGKGMTGYSILSGRYNKRGNIPGDNVVTLPARVIAAECKGKFIYITFTEDNNEYYLFSTLGMTGMWSSKRHKHARFVIFFDDGSELYYNDIRNFGTLKFIKDKDILDKKLKSLGPDILTAEIDCQGFRNRFIKKQNKTIAECLMNQSVIAGVGNYLKAEILWNSKMSPNRLVRDITNEEWHDLYYNTLTQSQRSYKLGGATIESYRQPNGKEGLYSRRFAVYNQKTDPNGRVVIKETTADKRTTHWVPEIQK